MLDKKYRPKDFKDVIGNRDTITVLESILAKNSPPHTLLFHGPSGCGKTTLARIFARKIGCSELDIVEINSSSNRGIETSREIIKYAKTAPLEGENKAFILDEFHKVSNDGQTALNKLLEDHPKKVFFLICTTHPDKIIAAIKNRATPFGIGRIPTDLIEKRLFFVACREKKRIDRRVLDNIADLSNGSMRSALVMLERIIDLKPEEIEAARYGMEVFDSTISEFCQGLLKKIDWSDLMSIKNRLIGEPEQIRWAVMGYMNTILSKSLNKKAGLIMESFEGNYYDTGKNGLTLSCYNYYLT